MGLAASVLLGFALTAHAQAQDFDTQVRTQELEAQLNAARQRDVALRNEMMAMEARVQADTSVRLLEAERNAAAQRVLRPSGEPDGQGVVDPGYASIPDGRLSESNARVKSATGKRHR